jgi:uncharacterized protein
MIDSSNSISTSNLTDKLTAILISLSVLLNPIFFLFAKPAFLVVIGSAGLLFLLALSVRDPMTIHIGLLNFLMGLCAGIWSWPLCFLLPIVVYGAIVAIIPTLRQTTNWLSWGKFDWLVWCFSIVTVILSSVGLVLWFLWGQADLNRQLALIPNWSFILLIAGGAIFALTNAAIEEIVYRGVLMQGLDTVFGSGKFSVLLQAIPFGLLHLNGTPSGWLGVSMAGVYGLLLGSIKRRSQGMLAPFMTHVFADITIFSMLVILAQKKELL